MRVAAINSNIGKNTQRRQKERSNRLSLASEPCVVIRLHQRHGAVSGVISPIDRSPLRIMKAGTACQMWSSAPVARRMLGGHVQNEHRDDRCGAQMIDLGPASRRAERFAHCARVPAKVMSTPTRPSGSVRLPCRNATYAARRRESPV